MVNIFLHLAEFLTLMKKYIQSALEPLSLINAVVVCLLIWGDDHSCLNNLQWSQVPSFPAIIICFNFKDALNGFHGPRDNGVQWLMLIKPFNFSPFWQSVSEFRRKLWKHSCRFGYATITAILFFSVYDLFACMWLIICVNRDAL